ncbi:MAG: hypothetical protein Q7J29_02640 [Stagnimonas sp.]|nr:hypothetical protein [Stagnimonas sp.]
MGLFDNLMSALGAPKANKTRAADPVTSWQPQTASPTPQAKTQVLKKIAVETKRNDFEKCVTYKLPGDLIGDRLGDKNLRMLINCDVYDDERTPHFYIYLIYFGQDWIFVEEEGESLAFLVGSEKMSLCRAGDDRHDVMENAMVSEAMLYPLTPAEVNQLSKAQSLRLRLRGSHNSVERELKSHVVANIKTFINDYYTPNLEKSRKSINEKKERSELKVTVDSNDEGSTVILHQELIEDGIGRAQRLSVSAYFVQVANDAPVIIFGLVYSGKEWLFIKKDSDLSVEVDGDTLIPEGLDGFDRQTTDDGVTETVTLMMRPKHAAFILKAKSVTFNVSGSEGSFSRVVPNELLGILKEFISKYWVPANEIYLAKSKS